MKSVLLLLLSLALLPLRLAAADPVHPEWWDEASAVAPVAPALLRPDEAVVLDGSLAEWAELPGLPLGLTHQTGFDRDWRGRADVSAMVRLAATPAALCVALEVRDDRLLIAPAGDRFKGDLVRLYLGPADAKPAATQALVLAPPLAQEGGEQRAALFDGDRREPLPGIQLAWQVANGGYRAEVRIPWPAVGPDGPEDRRTMAVQVVDWDEPAAERATLTWPADLRPRPAAPPETKPAGYDPPRLPPRVRPERVGELRPIEALRLSDAAAFLPAVLPVGAERSFYAGDEDVRIIALSGIGLAAVAAMDLLVADEQGAITRLSAGDGWSEGAVEGIAWTWRTPWQFPKSVLLAGSLAPLGHDLRVYGLLTSVGEGYQAYLDRLAGLRERMMAAATAPGATPRLRRHLGSVLINLEDKGQSQAGWATWMARDDLERLNDEIDELEAQFRAAAAGRDPLGGKKGTYLRGYVSEMDDTLQHYSVAVPDAWSPTARLPLLISLHGYGFGRFLGHPAPSYPDAVAVACFGRGNGDYKLWCEQDILTVLDAMLEDYGVDPDRVYITGGSMGGTGSWHMATMYPDRFAAIGPTAGNANHHVWEEVWGWGQREPTFMTPFRDWLESTTSAFQYADNLRHVGVYCLHGTLDNICPVGHARTMVERLRNLSYDVVYEEFPEVGHGGFPGAAAARQKNYLFSRARDPYPRQVTWRTSWHRYPGAYWVAVERFGRQGQDARIDARVDGQQIAVTTVNVQRLRLDLSDRLLDRAAPINVTVDGLPAYQGPVPVDGALRLGRAGDGWQAVARPAGREKNPTVGGPLEHAFMSRFLLVCGTAGDRRENEVNRRMTEQLAEKWRRWGREQRARVKMDWEVTEQDIAESNLICFGGPASNRFVRRINDRLPIRLTPEGVVAGQELFAGQDVGVKLCYPNPLNPDRYVCVFGGVSWEGTYDINGRFGNWFDWGVFDDRNWFDFSIFDAHTQSPETHLMVGYFDQDWRLDEAVVFRGDAALRRLTRPRRPPDPLAALPDGDEVYLSEITPLRITMEKGVLGYDQSFAGNPITLGSMVFDRGLGVHPQAEVVYDIGGQFAAFEAWVGVDLEGASSVSKAREEAERVAFQLYGDGQLLADTGEMRWNTPPRRIVANVEGVKQLTLMARALDGRKWLFGDASWGLARLSRARPARVAAPVVPIAADRLQLDGAWLLDDYAVGEGVARGAERPQAELATERRIHLPGSIPVALAAAGELPEPYRNDHLRQVAELAKREWWLYRWFDVPTAWQGRRLQLTLSGVTQQAEAWVNGDYVGRASGPFSATTLEVGGPTRFGQRNLLAIRLLAGSAPWTNVRSFAVPARETQVARGTDYGLDGGGLAPALGLGEVTLKALGPVSLGRLRVSGSFAGEPPAGVAALAAGEVVVVTTATNHDREPHLVRIKGEIAGGGQPAVPFERELRLAAGESAPVRIAVAHPGLQAWWPRGHGAATLYQVAVEARADNLVSDTAQSRCGVRSVDLAADGETPVLRVNGREIGFRVAEWRPLDRLGQGSRRRTEHLLRIAAETGFTAVRVWAGGGLAGADFYELCDELGLLVIQDMPLVGDLSRQPLDGLTAAVTGVVEATRNHPAVIAYGAGLDLPLSGGSAERLAAIESALRRHAPEHLYLEPTSSRGGPQVWRWIAPGARGEARSAAMPLWQVRLPTAPPRSLAFLDRERLPAGDRATPWPLTDLYRFHGGDDADLAAAVDWAGPLRAEDEPLAWLTRWQAESARRQLADALAAGEALYVSALNESWPRAGGALVDYEGHPRPARDVVQRFLRGPSVFARLSQPAVSRGEVVRVSLFARAGSGGIGQAPPTAWRLVACRIQGLDGQVWQSAELELPAAPQAGAVGELEWAVDASVPPGSYLVVTTIPGSGLPPDIVPLGVRSAAARRAVRTLWHGDGQPWSWIEPLPLSAVGQQPVEAVYLGPAATAPTAEQAAAVRAAVQGGAGLLLDGPPAWLGEAGLTDLLACVPAAAPATEPVPLRPTVLLADHPALAGLRGPLPEGSPGDYQEIAAGAGVLVEFGPDRPLLLETELGRGRVLLLRQPADYRRRLERWDGAERFYAGLLGYAAKLPYAQLKALLDSPDEAPLAALARLPAAPVGLTVATSPLLLGADHVERRMVKLRNDGATPILMVHLRLEDLPPGATAVIEPATFPLLPGEERSAVIAVHSARRSRQAGNARLVVDGWGAKAASVVLPYDG